MTTKAWLEGHPFDLDHLARLLPSGDIRVVRDGDRYYLASPKIDNPPAGTKYHEVAERLIKHVNGLGWASHSDFHPVRLTKIYDDEAGITAVPVAAHLEARAALSASVTVTDANGNVKPPGATPPGPARIALAGSNADVEEVFELMAPGEVDWDDLFKVHEKIQDSINGSIPKMGWASKAEDNAFCASANRRDISGRDARHARTEKRPPPKRTMTIEQGRQDIRDTVAKWLDYLASQP